MSPLLCLSTSRNMSRPLSLPSVPLDHYNLQAITTRWRVTAQVGDCVELESVETQINQRTTTSLIQLLAASLNLFLIVVVDYYFAASCEALPSRRFRLHLSSAHLAHTLVQTSFSFLFPSFSLVVPVPSFFPSSNLTTIRPATVNGAPWSNTLCEVQPRVEPGRRNV